MNVVLCGMMGCGKTTVARALAGLTGMECADTDEEVAKEHGRIADIFARDGEERFRTLERQAVRRVAARDGIVIATGGGCVLDAANVAELKKNGRIIFLRASLQTLAARLEGDTERPLLSGGVQKRIAELLPARTPAYMAAADFVVDTDGLAPGDIAVRILELCGIKNNGN